MRRAAVAVVVVLALAALVAGGTLAVRGLRAGQLGPDEVVGDYFAALERGDASAALGYGTIPSGSRALLSDAALRAQQAAAPIRDLEVVSTRTRGDRSIVQVGYQLGTGPTGSTVAADVALHRDDGNWVLNESAIPAQFDFNAAGDRATIAGVRAPTNAAAMFPGSFVLRFDSPYLVGTIGNDSITFGAATSRNIASTSVDVTLTASGRSATRLAVQAAVARCLERGGPTCPQPDERYVPGSLRGRLTGTLQHVSTSLTASPAGVVRVDAEAPATVRFRRLDFVDRPGDGHGDVRLQVHALAGLEPTSVRWTA